MGGFLSPLLTGFTIAVGLYYLISFPFARVYIRFIYSRIRKNPLVLLLAILIDYPLVWAIYGSTTFWRYIYRAPSIIQNQLYGEDLGFLRDNELTHAEHSKLLESDYRYLVFWKERLYLKFYVIFTSLVQVMLILSVSAYLFGTSSVMIFGFVLPPHVISALTITAVVVSVPIWNITLGKNITELNYAEEVRNFESLLHRGFLNSLR